MKMPLLIALTCPSLAFDDRGNDFSNGASDSGGYSFQSLLEWLSEYGQPRPLETVD